MVFALLIFLPPPRPRTLRLKTVPVPDRLRYKFQTCLNILESAKKHVTSVCFFFLRSLCKREKSKCALNSWRLLFPREFLPLLLLLFVIVFRLFEGCLLFHASYFVMKGVDNKSKQKVVARSDPD